MLTQAGYQVFTASNGPECIALLGRVTPNALLLDVDMPAMSGFELFKSLKGIYPSLKCPVIFVTSRRTAADVMEARNLGSDSFIAKPFTAQALLTRLEACLRGKRPS